VNPIQLRRGDILRLRRPHPCGNDLFEVVRLGADIGLHCTRCGRRLLLARSMLERRMEGFVKRGADPQPPIDMDGGSLGSMSRGNAGRDDAGPRDTGPHDAENDTDRLTPPALRTDDLMPEGLDPDPLDPSRPAL
jgi:hypothetical protein